MQGTVNVGGVHSCEPEVRRCMAVVRCRWQWCAASGSGALPLAVVRCL
jgi:hypothetical protein